MGGITSSCGGAIFKCRPLSRSVNFPQGCRSNFDLSQHHHGFHFAVSCIKEPSWIVQSVLGASPAPHGLVHGRI